MDFYFGIDLPQQLRQYYEGRLSLALAKGFDQQDAKYHWLFKELECRVSTLRKLMSMISVLPEFMCRQTEEQIFAMVIGHTTTWFSNENLGGEQPRDAKGNCLYYQDTNPYWVDMREAMDRFTLSYDYTHPVSYTHLDVYKRQDTTCSPITAFGTATSANWRRANSTRRCLTVWTVCKSSMHATSSKQFSMRPTRFLIRSS